MDMKVKCPFPEVTSWAGADPSWGQETYFNLGHLMWEELLSLPFADGDMKAWEEKITFPKSLTPEPEGLSFKFFCVQ